MKHVFLVHSPITYIMALSVMCEENLRNEEVIFLSNKQLQYANVIPVLCMNKLFCGINKILYGRKFDTLIKKITYGEPFYAYIPVMNQQARLLVTNSQCLGFHFIEEGLEAYFRNMTLDYLSSEGYSKKWRCTTINDYVNLLRDSIALFIHGIPTKTLQLPFHYHNYAFNESHIFYCSGKDAFSIAVNRKVCSIKNRLTKLMDYSYDVSDSYIWVSSHIFQSYPSVKLEIKEMYKQALFRFFKDNGCKQLFVKFHPTENKDSRKLTSQMFDELGVNYTIVPDNIILELALITSKNVTMISDYSSLLLYNYILGHHNVSVAKIIHKYTNFSEQLYSALHSFFIE